MIRQTVRSLALAAAGLALANVAWGQNPVLRQTASMPQVVAAEYFGSGDGREVLTSGFATRPYVQLAVDVADIGAANVGNITFTLGGATFSQTVSTAHLDYRTGDNCGTGSPQNNLLVTGVTAGGAKSDSSVTFEARANTGLTNGSFICFWLPDIQATLTTVTQATATAPAVMGVNVTAKVSQGATTTNPFPAAINGADVDHDMDAATDPIPGPITSKTILTVAPALMTSLGMGQVAQVSIKDRTKIASGGEKDPSVMDQSKAPMGVLVGTLTIDAAAAAMAAAEALTAATILKLDGKGSAAPGGVIDSSLGGQVVVSVGGPFQDGDKVVFGSGDDARQVEPAGGMATNTVELKGQTSMKIVYVPSGAGVLKPGVFAGMARYSFNNPDNNNAQPILPSKGEIRYAGLEVEGYAYGVVKGGGMDTSYGRATCRAASGACSVFVDCTDEAGMGYFGGPVMIPAGATQVIDSDSLAEALGGGWESGRGRCDVWSTHQLDVQHMVRSGHTLVNNSAVVGRGLDESRDADLMSIQEIVTDICNSVGMNDGEASTVLVDTACMSMDTVEEQ